MLVASLASGAASQDKPTAESPEQSSASLAPCSIPLRWYIANLDPEFGLDTDDARAAVEAAAWERTIGQDLFVDDPSGELPVLRTGEGLVMGEAMPIPSKIQFFKARDRPRGDDPEMPEAWRQDRPDGEHYAQAVKNWRYQRDTTEEGNENA
jgi:hypothetical protein